MDQKWDPVMLDAYLSKLDHKVADEQRLETRRRVSSRLVVDLRSKHPVIDLRPPESSTR